jgi:hypothetical protein
MPTYMLGTAVVFALIAVTLAALQAVTVLPASGLPVTLLIIAAALTGLRFLTARKAPRS